jgi:ABC-type dipeptide/oligopeptide/nickel transport system ATPase subunit
MSNKKQTAVEWYNQQIVDRQNANGDSRSRDEILEQAKQIESNKNQKFDEMLEMLQNIFEDYDYAIDNWQELEQLIKEATEI